MHRAFGLPVTIDEIERYLSGMVTDQEPIHNPTKISELTSSDLIECNTLNECLRILIMANVSGDEFKKLVLRFIELGYSLYDGIARKKIEILYRCRPSGYNIIPSTQITQP